MKGVGSAIHQINKFAFPFPVGNGVNSLVLKLVLQWQERRAGGVKWQKEVLGKTVMQDWMNV